MNNNHQLPENIKKIAKEFAVEGGIKTIKPYGSGHINDTFLVENTESNCPDYLLQRINHHIFKDVEGVIVNIYMVTAHLDAKLKSKVDLENSDEQVLTLIPAKNSVLFFKDTAGNFWRMYQFIKNSVSYNVVSSTEQAYEGGQAFGRFQRRLSDMNPELLTETIVNFHDITMRLTQFKDAMQVDEFDRLKNIETEIHLIKEYEEYMCSIYKMGEAGLLPIRITHNDTKFNNILFDTADKAICIIDLDTVMPGYIAYDFGDAIRSLVNTSEEDEPNINKIDVNIPLFEAYTQGYLKEAMGFLTEEEIDSLYHAVFLFPYMQGVRFLTDYLNGDCYYKTAYPDHNLVRTRAQFQLFRKLNENKSTLKQIINEALKARITKN
jgi:Ser/Thr protein kinase RdoA (MazF antagonist)